MNQTKSMKAIEKKLVIFRDYMGRTLPPLGVEYLRDLVETVARESYKNGYCDGFVDTMNLLDADR